MFYHLWTPLSLRWPIKSLDYKSMGKNKQQFANYLQSTTTLSKESIYFTDVSCKCDKPITLCQLFRAPASGLLSSEHAFAETLLKG